MRGRPGQSFGRFSKENALQEQRREEILKKSLRPGNKAFFISRKWKILRLLILVACGVSAAAAFPPLELSLLGWICLIPLYFLVMRRSPAKAFLDAYIWGYAWSVSAFFWLREIEFFVPWLVSLVLALFPAVWAACVPFLRRHLFVPAEIQLQGYEREMLWEHKNRRSFRELLLALSLAALWVVLEWIRTWIGTGLPWNLLAVSQWRNISLIQICGITGVYGVSFLLVFFNIGFASALEMWFRIAFQNGKYRRPVPFLLSLGLIMLSVIVGSSSLRKFVVGEDDSVEIIAGVIQADIPQCRAATEEQARAALDQHINLSAQRLLTKPDIVIWPETAVPVPYRAGHPTAAEYRSKLEMLAAMHETPFMIGTIDFEFGSPGTEASLYNSALLIDADGNIVDKYHKMHLVPWGEYTPWGHLYPRLKEIFGMGRDLSPGTRHTIFNLKDGVRAGVNICYEDVFPEISRGHTLAGANLLLVLTNDAWYPKSSEPLQHLTHAVFRAVENRRPVLRVGNNCCSCLIGVNGEILDSILKKYDKNEKRDFPYPEKRLRGHANFKVRAERNPELSFYTRYGNIFVYICILSAGSILLAALLEWKKKKERLIDLFKGRGIYEDDKPE